MRRILFAIVLICLCIVPVMANTWNIINVNYTPDIVVQPASAPNYYQSLVLSMGYPHITYLNSTTLYDIYYTIWNGTSWTSEIIVSTGSQNSLAINSTNYPAIAYYNQTDEQTWYAARNNGIWNHERAGVHSSPGFPIGPGLSLAFNQTDNASIAYSSNSIKYTVWDGVQWNEIQVTGADADNPSLAINSTNYPSIAYFDDGGNDLDMVCWTGATGWVQGIVDSTIGNVGSNPSLVFNSTDNATISYADTTNLNLRYAVGDSLGWTRETVDSVGDVGYQTSQSLDSSDYPHVAYYDNTNGALKHAWKNDTGWHTETVAYTGIGAIYPKIAIDQYDNIFISYYNITDGYLKLAYYIAPPPVPPNIIYGLVLDDNTGLPINGANANIRNATWSATNISFHYAGFDGVYWFDNLPPNENYYLNATKLGYIVHADVIVNTGAAGSAIRQDLYLTPSYTLTLNVVDLYSSALITSTPVNVATTGTLTTSVSTATGIASISPVPVGWITTNVTALGYYPSVTSYLMTSDRNETVYLLSLSSQQVLVNTMYPREIRFIVVDKYGNRIDMVNVTAQMTSTTIPAGSTWWQTLLGIGASVVPTPQAATLFGFTDSNGAVVFPMVASGYYTMSFVNATKGVSAVKTVHPQETEYMIVVTTPGTAPKVNCWDYSNISLFTYAPTSATVWLNMTWNDTSLTSTGETYFINWPNGTLMYYFEIPVYFPGVDNQTSNWSYEVNNIKGDAYVWGLYAENMCGNVTRSQGITLNGPTGILINFFSPGCTGWSC